MILAIDTLTPRTQICVGEVARVFPPSKDQAEALMGHIEMCLSEAQCAWNDITGVVVLTGPGSFTGLRVGLSVAQGIGIARNIPVWGVTVPQAFEMLLPQDEAHWILIDTRRKDLALAYRAKGNDTFEPLVEATIEDTCAMILKRAGNLSGNGISMLPPKFLIDMVIPREWIDLAALVKQMHSTISERITGYHAIECEPVYLRAPDVTLSTQKFEHQSLYVAK